MGFFQWISFFELPWTRSTLSKSHSPERASVPWSSLIQPIVNLALWWESGYFDTPAELKPLLHLWSLGIEEQFYFVWPMVLAIAWPRRWMGAMLAAVTLESFALGV